MKTRMQLETGKSQHGFVGTFRSIIREEGYAAILVQEIFPLIALPSGLDVCTEVLYTTPLTSGTY